MKHRWLTALVAVFALAFAVRLVAASRVLIIERDGLDYLAAAKPLAHGDLRGTLAHYYPPAYPAAVALVARTLGREPDERSGQVASALAGAALALAVTLAGALAFGRRSGVLAGLVAAVHPSCVEQAAKVTADALFAALALAALAAATAALAGRRSRLLLVVAGALSSLAYLARPEGILVLACVFFCACRRPPESAPARARAHALLILLGGLSLTLAYVISVKPDAGLNGGEAGAWKLTKKRELFLEAGGERVFPRGADGARHLDVSGAASVGASALARAAWQLWLTLAEGNVVLVLALLGALGLPRPRRRQLPREPAGGTLVLLAAGSSVLLLGAYSLIRTDARYGAILFTLALPFAGRGLELAVARVAKWDRTERILIAAVLLTFLFPAVRERLLRKVTWREAAEDCRKLHLDPIAAADPRVAFYASATLVDLVPVLRDSTVSSDARARAVVSLARSRGARAIVLGDTHPDEQALVAAVVARLRAEDAGRDPALIPYQRAGSERVVLLRGW